MADKIDKIDKAKFDKAKTVLRTIFDTLIQETIKILKWIWARLLDIYHPENLKKRGGVHSFVLISLTVLGLMFLIGLWWNHTPSFFDVQAVAQEKAEDYDEKIVPGYVTTNTLIEVANTLLYKSGGYLSNDIMPPSVFMDDMPSWEWGVLQQVRDFSKALRNDMSRSQTQSEDPDLAKATPKFNTDNDSWFWPASESEYEKGIVFLENFLHRLAAPKNNSAQFLIGGNNLGDWLEEVIKRFGSLSQRLSASVGQKRMKMNLSSDVDAQEPSEIEEKTPWKQVDDVFYEAQGASWALIHFLRAVEVDYKDVLERKYAMRTLQEVIRELEATQKTVWSPMILNGSEFGLFANHSLVLSSYISRATMGIIELYNLLNK
ncbi:MAG: DUF2333 family protein [Thiomargarita sp.]|nr:DUF2333 family protein [Thiomargarita sp.]